MHRAVASIVHASLDACAHLPPRCACPHLPAPTWAPPNVLRRTAEAHCTIGLQQHGCMRGNVIRGSDTDGSERERVSDACPLGTFYTATLHIVASVRAPCPTCSRPPCLVRMLYEPFTLVGGQSWVQEPHSPGLGIAVPYESIGLQYPVSLVYQRLKSPIHPSPTSPPRTAVLSPRQLWRLQSPIHSSPRHDAQKRSISKQSVVDTEGIARFGHE